MRKSNGTDFHVDVEWKPKSGGVESLGRFCFGRRTMRDVFLIRSEYNRLSNGNYGLNGEIADIGAWAIANLSVLMVSAPDSFDMDNVDPLTDDTWEDKAAEVFTALRAKELSFRPKRPEKLQEAGPRPSEELPVDIPKAV